MSITRLLEIEFLGSESLRFEMWLWDSQRVLLLFLKLLEPLKVYGYGLPGRGILNGPDFNAVAKFKQFAG